MAENDNEENSSNTSATVILGILTFSVGGAGIRYLGIRIKENIRVKIYVDNMVSKNRNLKAKIPVRDRWNFCTKKVCLYLKNILTNRTEIYSIKILINNYI